MNDTSLAADAVQARIHRGLPGTERLVLTVGVSESAHDLCFVLLRHAHPDWADRKLRRELLCYAFLAVDGAPTELPLR